MTETRPSYTFVRGQGFVPVPERPKIDELYRLRMGLVLLMKDKVRDNVLMNYDYVAGRFRTQGEIGDMLRQRGIDTTLFASKMRDCAFCVRNVHDKKQTGNPRKAVRLGFVNGGVDSRVIEVALCESCLSLVRQGGGLKPGYRAEISCRHGLRARLCRIDICIVEYAMES